MEFDRPQRDRNCACVIAQQYSSVNLGSMRFRFRKEKIGSC
jgi:hypothetical protein